jgi:CRISPR-associated exonuclease Cas4
MTLGIIVLLLALALFVIALRLRRASGLPWQRVAMSDVGMGRQLQRPLYAARYGLTGKPDYILEAGGTYVPVEVKPSRRSARPYDSDLMQLAAYCLLIEEHTGKAPTYGLLRYAEQTFRLEYNDTVRDELLTIIDEMRTLLDADDCERSHDEAQRCAACGFVEICDEAL